MKLNSVEAIAFDFGNTICPWDDRQYWQVTRGAMEQICRLVPGLEFESAYRTFSYFRAKECAKNLPMLRENDISLILRSTAEELAGRAISENELLAIIEAQIRAFVGACRAPVALRASLDRLAQKYRLAVLSNYSLPQAVRLALENMGLSDCFHTILVSADIGRIKPSRELFQHLLFRLGYPPEKVLFVGDDWLADIVGAHIAGMPSIQVTDYTTQEFAQRMDIVFGRYIRRALSSPEYAGWEQAKPIATLKSVLELENWLDGKVK